MYINLDEDQFQKLRAAVLFLNDVVEPECIDLIAALEVIKDLHIARNEQSKSDDVSKIILNNKSYLL